MNRIATLRETQGTNLESWAVSAEEELRQVARSQRSRIKELETENAELKLQLREAEGVADLNRRRRA